MQTRRIILSLSVLLLLAPSFTNAATFAEKKTLVLATSTPDNTYLAGTNITVSAPLPADLSAAGGTVNVYAPIGGDALVAGGTVNVQQNIAGDVRAIGANVSISAPVRGDVVVGGATVNVSAPVGDMRLFGANVQATGGANGPVTIYGADVTLSGTYNGDVEVIASDHFTLGPNTHIHGMLKYNAPTQVDIPASSNVDGAVTYTGSYNYVPTNAEARTFAIAGAGIFYIVRALAVMSAAALLAGMFPHFSEALAKRVFVRRRARAALLILLGFALLIATPVLVLLLGFTLVGGALALILGALYVLLVLLSYIYAGILVGGMLRHAITKRSPTLVSWKEALGGMLVLFIIGSLPILGGTITLLALCLTLGAISSGLYRFAFKRDWQEEL